MKEQKVEQTEKQVHDALSFSHKFLEVSQGFLPEDFVDTLTADKFYILVGFQFGAFCSAAHTVGLSPRATSQIFPTLLEKLNGVSTERAKQISSKLHDLINKNYPPIEIGGNALDSFYSSESEAAKLKYAKELALLISQFEESQIKRT